MWLLLSLELIFRIFSTNLPKVLKLSGGFEIIPQRFFQNATGEKEDSNLHFLHACQIL